MIPINKWIQFKKEHPSICGTCFYYRPAGNKPQGYCWGSPPISNKTIRVYPSRIGCAHHQDNVEDLQRMIFSHDLVSAVVSALALFLKGSNGR